MRLSIVIPTYNRSEHLLDLLDSVKNLNLTCDFEVIISDNCSTDNTKSSVKKFKNKNQDMEIIFLESPTNYGFGFNINKAISYAKGDYIWPVGSDDIFLETTISIEDCLSKNPTYILFDCLSNSNLPRNFYKKSDVSYSNFLFLQNINKFSGALTFISNIIFNRNAYLNIKKFEDDDYTHFINFYIYLSSCDKFTIYFAEDVYIKSGVAPNEYNIDRAKHFLLDCKTVQKIGTYTKNIYLKNFLINLIFENYNFEYIKSSVSKESWELVEQYVDSLALKLPFNHLKYIYYGFRKIL